MPLSSSLIATVGLTAALLTQVQDPTFDVQVAVPGVKKPPQTDPSHTPAPGNVSTDSGIATGVRPSVKIDLGGGTTQTAPTQATASAQVTYADAVKAVRDAFGTATPTLQLPQTPTPQLSPMAPLPQINVRPYGSKPVTPQPGWEFGWQDTVPPFRMWTWDKSQFKDFDDASKAFRDWMMKKPGFERFQQREFGFYATPLKPGKDFPLFVWPDAKGKSRMFVMPPQDGKSPKFFYMPDQKWPSPKIYTIPGKDWVNPKLFTRPDKGWSPKIYTFPKVYSQPYEVWSAPKARLNIDSKAGTIFGTLTPHQKEIQKSRGYLHFNELTPAQQKLLTNPKGQFEIQYHSGSNDLTIKS